MKTLEIPVANQTTVSASLAEETFGVDEVVVVGYGVQKRSDITGSVTSVPRERLSKLPVNNVAAAMSPYAKMYDENGNLTHYPMYSETSWANPLLPTTLDPERRQFNISVNGYAEMDLGKIWKPLNGLKYKFNGGYSFVPYRRGC